MRKPIIIILAVLAAGILSAPAQADVAVKVAIEPSSHPYLPRLTCEEAQQAVYLSFHVIPSIGTCFAAHTRYRALTYGPILRGQHRFAFVVDKREYKRYPGYYFDVVFRITTPHVDPHRLQLPRVKG
jgi:hypothetical protein